MAERVEDYDYTRGKYPWDKWLDGKSYRITYGEDFKCPMRSMKSMIHEAAVKRGLGAQVRSEPPASIVFRAIHSDVEAKR